MLPHSPITSKNKCIKRKRPTLSRGLRNQLCVRCVEYMSPPPCKADTPADRKEKPDYQAQYSVEKENIHSQAAKEQITAEPCRGFCSHHNKGCDNEVDTQEKQTEQRQFVVLLIAQPKHGCQKCDHKVDRDSSDVVHDALLVGTVPRRVIPEYEQKRKRSFFRRDERDPYSSKKKFSFLLPIAQVRASGGWRQTD